MTSTATIVSASSVQTGNSSNANTYITDCTVAGPANGLWLQIVSDKSGSPLNDTAVSAVFSAGCNGERETLHLDKMTQGPGGWISFEDGYAGLYNFSVPYQGQVYAFQESSHPLAITCVILEVPSGVVLSLTYEFASGSCYNLEVS